MKKQRFSKTARLALDPANPFSSVLDYRPNGKTARLDIRPSFDLDFPDVLNIDLPIKDGMRAPVNLFPGNDGFVGWVEIQDKRRAIYALTTNGDFLQSSVNDMPPTGAQWLTVQTDPAGKVEYVTAFVSDGTDAFEIIKRAAILYQFDQQAKPIASGQTKVLSVDRERLEHNYVATLSAPGATFNFTGPVSEIRARKMSVDSFRYWQRAFIWPTDSGQTIIGQSVFGNYHIATFDTTGTQKFSSRTELFTSALTEAQNQIIAL